MSFLAQIWGSGKSTGFKVTAWAIAIGVFGVGSYVSANKHELKTWYNTNNALVDGAQKPTK